MYLIRCQRIDPPLQLIYNVWIVAAGSATPPSRMLPVFLGTFRWERIRQVGRVGPCHPAGRDLRSIRLRSAAVSMRRGLLTIAATGRECWLARSAWCGTALGLGPLGNLKAAWHVMRANRVWGRRIQTMIRSPRRGTWRGSIRMAPRGGPADRRSTDRRRGGGRAGGTRIVNGNMRDAQ